MKKYVFTLVACLLVAVLALTGCAGPAEQSQADGDTEEPVEIKYAVVGSDTHQYTIMANEFKKAVEAKSDGKIKVSIFPNAQLGSEREMAEGVRMGTIQMTTVTSDGSFAGLGTGTSDIQLALSFPRSGSRL